MATKDCRLRSIQGLQCYCCYGGHANKPPGYRYCIQNAFPIRRMWLIIVPRFNGYFFLSKGSKSSLRHWNRNAISKKANQMAWIAHHISFSCVNTTGLVLTSVHEKWAKTGSSRLWFGTYISSLARLVILMVVEGVQHSMKSALAIYLRMETSWDLFYGCDSVRESRNSFLGSLL